MMPTPNVSAIVDKDGDTVPAEEGEGTGVGFGVGFPVVLVVGDPVVLLVGVPVVLVGVPVVELPERVMSEATTLPPFVYSKRNWFVPVPTTSGALPNGVLGMSKALVRGCPVVPDIAAALRLGGP
jgi:hypothetical protein